MGDNIINRPTTAVATLDQSSQATLRGNVAQCRSQLRSNSAAVQVAPRAGAPAVVPCAIISSLVSTEPVNFYFFLLFTRGKLNFSSSSALSIGQGLRPSDGALPSLCVSLSPVRLSRPLFHQNWSTFQKGFSRKLV